MWTTDPPAISKTATTCTSLYRIRAGHGSDGSILAGTAQRRKSASVLATATRQPRTARRVSKPKGCWAEAVLSHGWTQKVISSDGLPSDFFGCSIAVEGDTGSGFRGGTYGAA
jgi:hypothetical protein